MKKLIRKLITVICFMAIFVPITAFAKEGGNSKVQEPKLINTQEWPTKGLTAISIVYKTDAVKILPSSSDKITLKEYLTKNKSSYDATTTIEGGVLNIKLGSRPTTSYASRIEIYIPAKFKGSAKVDVTSGLIEIGNISSSRINANSTSGIITINNYSGDLNCNAISGIVIINDCIVRGKVQTQSGGIDLQLNGINGDFEVISNTGSLTANIHGSTDFNIAATTGTGWVTNNFSKAFSTSKKNITGSWGKKTNHTITLKTKSGLVEISIPLQTPPQSLQQNIFA